MPPAHDRPPARPAAASPGVALFAVALALLGLPSSACVSQLHPIPPASAAALTQVPADIDVEASSLQLVVPIDFADLNRMFSESLPVEIAALQNIPLSSEVTGSFRLARVGNVVLLANEGRLQVIIPLTLEMEAAFSTRVLGIPIGHRERAIAGFALRVDTRISADEAWNATSESTIDYQLTTVNVGLGPFRFDVRRLLDSHLRSHIGALRDVVDEHLSAAIDLRARMERLWPRVLEPIRVMDEPALFVQLEPTAVQWVRPRVDTGRFTFGLGVAARVRTYMDAPPALSDPPPLPPLYEVESVGNGFHLHVPLQVPFSTLTAQAQAALVGSERQLESGATIRIESVEVRGATDGRVHILCGINARKGILRSAEGVLHMIGVPRYDPATRTLRFEDVAYDLDTRNVLLRAANWAMHDDFLAGVQAALEFEVGESLDAALVAVNENTRDVVVSDQLTLHVQVERIGIGPILVSDRAVVIVGLADGTVAADVSLYGRPADTVLADTRR